MIFLKTNFEGSSELVCKLIVRCICLYCEKVFKSPAVLKVHMRKKRHYKINPKNKDYDRFYLINYLVCYPYIDLIVAGGRKNLGRYHE